MSKTCGVLLVVGIVLATVLTLGGNQPAAGAKLPGSASHARKTKTPVLPAMPSGVAAYGLVEPICETCEPPKDFSPLSPTKSRNVTLDSPTAAADTGDWCFAVQGHTGAAFTIVASAVGGQTSEQPGVNPTSFSSAQWVEGAPDCKPSEVEIRTDRYLVISGALVARPERYIPFSFVVLDGSS
jgi:hypothetical protein